MMKFLSSDDFALFFLSDDKLKMNLSVFYSFTHQTKKNTWLESRDWLSAEGPWRSDSNWLQHQFAAFVRVGGELISGSEKSLKRKSVKRFYKIFFYLKSGNKIETWWECVCAVIFLFAVIFVMWSESVFHKALWRRLQTFCGLCGSAISLCSLKLLEWFFKHLKLTLLRWFSMK